MALSMKMVQRLKMGLELTGGLTSETVFPKTEDKINETDYQQALEFVGRRKNMDQYHSMMDFLFCETFPDPWKFKALKFYNGKGPKIIDDPDITDKILFHYDKTLCIVLEIALKMLNKRRESGWKEANWKMLQDLTKWVLEAA